MKTDLPPVQAEGTGRPDHDQQHEHRAHRLAQDRGQGGAGYAHIKAQDEQKIQHDIGQAGGHEKIQRAAGIPDGAQQAGADVIDQRRNHAQEINPQILKRRGHDVLGGVHPPKHQGRKEIAGYGQEQAEAKRQGHGGMDAAEDVAVVPGAEILGKDHGGAGGQPDKEPDDQVDQVAGGSAHGG